MLAGALKLEIGGFICIPGVGKTSSQSVLHKIPALRGDGKFELVKRFRYLGDMIGAGGGAEAASRARVRSAWCKFRELSPFLTKRGALLVFEGMVYVCTVSWYMVVKHGRREWRI